MERWLKYTPKPKVCQLCGGEVEFIDNSEIYGKPFGSGKAYRCKACGAYTGTHKDNPEVAMGILANKTMRVKRRLCHACSDIFWYTAGDPRAERTAFYKELAKRLGISQEDCHFGHFNEEMLDRAFAELCVMSEERREAFLNEHRKEK